MTEKEHPPVSASLAFFRAWCKEFDGTLKIVHKNPHGVIEIVQGGISHVYRYDKYGKNDKKYSWGSSFPVDFLAQCMNAYTEKYPEHLHDGKYEKT